MAEQTIDTVPPPAPRPFGQPGNPAHHGKFRTGAIPTPRHKLAAATPFRPFKVVKARPIVVPGFLEMWLNDQYGDCVSAEEAAALAFYSVMLGLPEVKITDATVKAFCDKYGFLNGANLTDVMDKMASDGFQQDGGYKDGPYAAVDYSNEATLQSALELGPVKLGMDSSALPSGAGSANGWYASGGTPGQFSNEDHSTGLWNYGPSAALFAALNTPVPSGFPATGYHFYTWSTVGVVDHAWVMSTVGEAWLRNPTSVSLGPGPTPPPPPTGNSLLVTTPMAAGTYPVPGLGVLVLPAPVGPGTYPITAGPGPTPGSPGSIVLGSALTAGSYSAAGGTLTVSTPAGPGTFPVAGAGAMVAPADWLAILCPVLKAAGALGQLLCPGR